MDNIKRIFLPQTDFFKNLVQDCINAIIPSDYVERTVDMETVDNNSVEIKHVESPSEQLELQDIETLNVVVSPPSIAIPEVIVPGDHVEEIHENIATATLIPKEEHPPCEPLLGNCFESCQAAKDGAGDIEIVQE